MSTCQRVCIIIAEQSGFPADEIGPAQCLGYEQTPNFYDRDALAKPLELDSLDRVELAMKLEEEFSIQISDKEADAPELDHVGGLVAFVQGKLDAKPPPRHMGDALHYLDPQPPLIDVAVNPGQPVRVEVGYEPRDPYLGRFKAHELIHFQPQSDGSLSIEPGPGPRPPTAAAIFEAGFKAGSGYPGYGTFKFDQTCLEHEWREFAACNGIEP